MMTATAIRVRSVDVILASTSASAPPRRRRRSRALVSFAVVFFALNASLAVLLEAGPERLRDPEYGLRLNSLRERRREHANRKLTVILGSSRTAMGIRPDVYEASLAESTTSPMLFNLSMSGAGPILQLIVLERLLAAEIRPDAVLLEFWPPLLRGDGFYREQNRLNPERLLTEDEPILVEFFTDTSTTFAKRDRGRALPVWYHRRALMDQYWPQAIPWRERADGSWSTLDGWGWLAGRKTYTAEQVEKGWPHVAGFYAPLFQTYSIDPLADRAYRKTLTRCRELGIAVRLIALPESGRFRSMMTPESVRLGNEYRTRIESECGVTTIDGRAWADDTALPDGYHLTQDGASAFTRSLAVHLGQ